MHRFIKLTAVLLLACAGLACSTYVRRLITLRTIDVDDYKSLPARHIAAATRPRPLPEAPDPAWVTRMPLAVQDGVLRSERELDTFLASRGTNAFLIVHDGKLVDERYFHGYTRESLFKTFSVSKSVLSALVGIAQSEGVLNIDDAVSNYVDIGDNQGLAGVTLHHLADNVSGFRYRRGNAPWKEQPRMYYTADVRALVARAEVIRTPGTHFEPEELSPLLLGYALERALLRKYPGMTLSRYAEERLWQPIGAAYPALWNLDHAEDGLEKTESGFVARAVDLARLGMLYLDNGKVDNRQVLPAEWVASTITPPPMGAPNHTGSGFHRKLWWGVLKPESSQNDFYANGHFGQRIYVSPDKRLVVIRLGFDSAGVNWTALLGRIAEAWPAAAQTPPRTLVHPSSSSPRRSGRVPLRFATLWLLTLLAVSCASAPDLKNFEREVESLRTAARIPGLSVAVVRNGDVIFARGFGYADVSRQIPATPDTPYDIASVSKPLSAVVALRLVELGLLDLDRPIADYSDWAEFCKDFSEQPSIFAKELRCEPAQQTLRHLLTHTATGRPGERFSYNPVLYSWASRPIRKVADASFSDLVARYVFVPAGMTQSARTHRDLPLRADLAAAIARPYRIDANGQPVPSAEKNPQGDGAAGGVISTVLDLARFDAALERGKLISPGSYAAMMAPAVDLRGERLPYALGWFVQQHDGHTLVWHSGWWEDAYSALYLKVPDEKLTLIVLANSEGVWWHNPLDRAEVEESQFAQAFFRAFLPPKR